MRRPAFAVFFACAMFAVSAARADNPGVNAERGSDAAVAANESTNEAAGTEMPATAPSAAPSRPASMEEICAMLVASADAHQLPLPFFVRLIWQESRFRSHVVSWAGARGIAQFMPGTADWRGLTD